MIQPAVEPKSGPAAATKPVDAHGRTQGLDAGKRINLVLGDQTYNGVMDLSRDTRRSLSELIRWGLALVRIAIEEGRTGNRLVVTKANGEPIREIVIPF